jgi:hypothetical protein
MEETVMEITQEYATVQIIGLIFFPIIGQVLTLILMIARKKRKYTIAFILFTVALLPGILGGINGLMGGSYFGLLDVYFFPFTVLGYGALMANEK